MLHSAEHLVPENLLFPRCDTVALVLFPSIKQVVRPCTDGCPPNYIHTPRLLLQVAWSCSIGVFLRDFDALDIGPGAIVDGKLYARRFEASHMVVAPIIVGAGASIRSGSVVYGGTNVGPNW